MCPSRIYYTEAQSLVLNSIWRQDLWEIIKSRQWSFRNQVHVFLRDSRELCSRRTQPETCSPEESLRTQLCWHLHLRLPASRTVRNEFLLFVSLPIHGALSEQARLTYVSLPRAPHPHHFKGLPFPSPPFFPSFFCSFSPSFLSFILFYPCSKKSLVYSHGET